MQDPDEQHPDEQNPDDGPTSGWRYPEVWLILALVGGAFVVGFVRLVELLG